MQSDCPSAGIFLSVGKPTAIYCTNSKEKDKNMNYLTLDYIKQHSRICHDAEDDVLTRMGNAAERAILNMCNRSAESIYEEYGEMPEDLILAMLELTDHLYQHRSPTEGTSLSAVPYNFDILVKPYMHL